MQSRLSRVYSELNVNPHTAMSDLIYAPDRNTDDACDLLGSRQNYIKYEILVLMRITFTDVECNLAR